MTPDLARVALFSLRLFPNGFRNSPELICLCLLCAALDPFTGVGDKDGYAVQNLSKLQENLVVQQLCYPSCEPRRNRVKGTVYCFYTFEDQGCVTGRWKTCTSVVRHMKQPRVLRLGPCGLSQNGRCTPVETQADV